MTSAVSYALGDLLVRPGSQVRGNCLVSLGTRTVSLPVAITHGSAAGPVLAVTAGIHGAEYVPIVAVRQFIRDLDPTQMRGTIVACLQSSPAAFQERSAFINPLDGQNLNRSFPGHPGGGPTARLAAWLWENLLARADCYVDCHCGDLPETLDPFTSVSPGPDGVVSERSRALADCFDVARLIVNRTAGSTIREAALAGIPAALVEVGGEGRWSQEEADIQRRGLHRVAAMVGILQAKKAPGRTCPSSRTRQTCSATVPASGSPRSLSERSWSGEHAWAVSRTPSGMQSRRSWHPQLASCPTD